MQKMKEREKRNICKSVPLFSEWETNAKMAIECEEGRHKHYIIVREYIAEIDVNIGESNTVIADCWDNSQIYVAYQCLA